MMAYLNKQKSLKLLYVVDLKDVLSDDDAFMS